MSAAAGEQAEMTLHIGTGEDGQRLPHAVMTMTSVILAKKGAGKTNTAVVLAEEVRKCGGQVGVVDPVGSWYGIKSSADGEHPGLEFVVFGGDHADLPLEPDAGEVIARSVVEGRFSFVLDLSHLRKGELIRFMADFLTNLYRLNRQSMLLIVDEADTVAPQKPFAQEAVVLGAMQDVVRRGRARGLGVVMITQRPQVLNKDVLTQADILWALRMNHPKDLAAIKEWVDVHADPKVAKEMLKSLPDLPTGTAWLWAPDMNLLEKVPVRRRETFDSSRTPQPGEVLTEPKVMAPVDLDRLGKEIAATVQAVKENSPVALKAEVARLTGLLAERDKEIAMGVGVDVAAMEAELAEVRADRDRLQAEREAKVGGLMLVGARLSQVGSALAELREEFFRVIGYEEGEQRGLIQNPIATYPFVGLPAEVLSPHLFRPLADETAVHLEDVERDELKQITVPSKATESSVAGKSSAEGVTGPQMKILNAVAALKAVGVEPAKRLHVAFFAGYSNERSGGFSVPTGQLVSAGLLESRTGALALTAAAMKVVKPQPPASTADLHGKLQALLSNPEWRLLKVLIRVYPKTMAREALAENVGYSNARSGGFSVPMGKLVSMGLAESPAAGQVRGTEMLFVNGRR